MSAFRLVINNARSGGSLAIGTGLSVTGSTLNATGSSTPAYSSTFSAAGTNQSGATPLTAASNIITSGAANSGGILTITTPGTLTLNFSSQRVLNSTVNAIYVYPPVGAQIGSLGANVGYLLNAGASAIFVATTATQLWVTV